MNVATFIDDVIEYGIVKHLPPKGLSVEVELDIIRPGIIIRVKNKENGMNSMRVISLYDFKRIVTVELRRIFQAMKEEVGA